MQTLTLSPASLTTAGILLLAIVAVEYGGVFMLRRLRTHERLGARYAGICPRSNIFVGTVVQWEQWTNLKFFESGEYLAPGMMNPFHVNLATNRGTYTEPNVWMIHELSPEEPGRTFPDVCRAGRWARTSPKTRGTRKRRRKGTKRKSPRPR